ncbi:uncharacterized protein LOC124538094 [Vanessa cardui]|uniref:uncharacterized protein LOC124538094 n=1 Tax=Vanessa cardui TaxID=171605 RepID=UPI001F1418AC|nr:uncharacterized protein LOC124538094 [Vanessa cardui]
MSSEEENEVNLKQPTKKHKLYGRLSDVNKKIRLQSHETGPSCNCKRYKCFEAVNEEQRATILKDFNLLPSRDEQNLYLCGLIRVLEIQRRRPRKEESEAKLHTANYAYRVRVVDETQQLDVPGSKTSLRQIIKELGFRWKKTENNRKVLIETTNIRLKRIEYLEKIKKYREEGRPIVYTDESYVDSSHSNPKVWTVSSTKGLKTPISKGQCVVIVHAGHEAGFIPNALLTFKAGSKSGDYHDNMNYENYEKWFRTQLIPNLPPKSVVVVDNASYHNKQYDLTPTSNSKKVDMQAWLSEKGIPHDNNMLKPRLYQLIKTHKEQYKTFSIDKILAEYNHNILRLPPYHPDLNPIEMAWSTIKQYVGSKNVKWNVNRAMELVKEKGDLMGAREWGLLYNKVKSIEEEYGKSDHIIDLMTDELVIRVSDDEDSSDSEESQESDNAEMSGEDNVPSSSCFHSVPSYSMVHDDLMEGISRLSDD